ncbi:poly(ADP-ribose) glycohydrolase isoform X16 [Apis cerana]|uniref:poly(ADP-ribose) glycohydrolase isoform X16 n=1 Tax=Apis cerana TaxID=7461 RepID=UPI002B23366D|nr:poly(ADP-ribose) glycohydrolase isoform X16 [Apis cerana]XP_061936248.1 poly(ADP-ribose) glycohydrolase isoform X16 [Apis cerana]XP_061936249.1 poly(ADP-ribose) glycohydrolase isoform X16 [Apis cerana]
MALVMLPCDLPWWPAVVKQLERAAAARNSEDLVEAMQRLHDMCNISLDPEEDIQDPELFSGLATFLDTDLDSTEQDQIFVNTIPRMVERAKALRSCKPPQGLHFSLQQQGDCVEYSYAFISSLIANAFFSTYPKRTAKTHPTLRDFNFTNFFKHLHNNGQKAKLRSIFRYYDYLDTENALDGKLIISRQVMTSKQWLTIEDWLESNVPLCPLMIRHEGRLDRIEPETKVLRVCFASAKFGGGVLDGDVTQETVHIVTHPEMLVAILSVEALEDNEVLIVEGVRHISRINDPHNKAIFEALAKPNIVTVCCIDPEDYSQLPLSQFEEDNILREMNKSLLGFRQRHIPSSPTDPVKSESDIDVTVGSRRLSPIGESFSSTPPEIEEIRSKPNGKSTRPSSPHKIYNDTNYTNKRNRFIVLGSSGEVLPVTRKSLGQISVYSSCNSQSTDSFHSAKDTIDEDVEEEQKLNKRYSAQLDTQERRGTFAQRLREALKRENTATGATSVNTSFGESSYAVGISVSGSHVCDQDIKVKRGGSRGFVLRDETVDEDFLKESLEAEQKWLGRFRQNQPMLQRKDTNASSRYSFSTEYNSDFCSELEEVYEQLAKWLEDPIANDESRELDARDRAVVQFAGSLLKRALSESFAGVPVQEGEPQPFIDSTDVNQSHKLALAVRSLSLELARQKNRRQQSIPRDGSPQTGGLLSIATGNWGCGSRLKGDPQLKLVIQWLAASLAGVPKLIYYTTGNPSLSKLDTISRVLMDRHWSVGDLAAATLRFALHIIEERTEGRNTLFEEIIGMDKPSP